MSEKIKFYKNVPYEQASKGQDANGNVVSDGSVIFCIDKKIYLKDNTGIRVYGAEEMPAAYKNYLDSQLKNQADSKFSVGIQLSNSTGIADALPSSQTATLRIQFNGSYVNPNSDPAGWTKQSTGVYVKSLSPVTAGTGTTTVSYTVEDGDYQGLTVTKSASATMSVSYPIFIGMVANPTPSTINISDLERRTTKLQNAEYTWQNNLDTAGYGCIITKGNATATQAGISIISNTGSGTVVSNGISMTGYKYYFTNKSVASMGQLDKVNITVNL